MFDLNKALEKVRGVKLRGGIVGKMTIAMIVLLLFGASVVYKTNNEYILSGAVVFVLLIVLYILKRTFDFAEKNPYAAIMEGAELLMHEKIKLGSKDNPTIDVAAEDITENENAVVTDGDRLLAQQPDTDTRRISQNEGEK